jgi:two-component system KDP operon response regulator KdpE
VRHATHRILIVEDEPAIRNILRAALRSSGYIVIEAENGERAQLEARSHKPDLMLLDLGLPDVDGLTVVRHVRVWSPMPIVVLSARTMEEQKIAALETGADDYVTKPFSAPELLARVRAALRRGVSGADQTPILKLGLAQIDLARRVSHSPQGVIHLTPLEYRLLECLARQAGMIVRQRQLLCEVWGPDRQNDARALRVCMKYLRDKLEPEPHKPRFLVTEIGLGYRLCVDDVAGAPVSYLRCASRS